MQKHQTLTAAKACSDQSSIQTSPRFAFSSEAVNKTLISAEFHQISVSVSKQL